MFRILLLCLLLVPHLLHGCGQQGDESSDTSSEDSQYPPRSASGGGGGATWERGEDGDPKTGEQDADSPEAGAPRDDGGGNDQPLAVDAGNPKDVGPKPKPNFRLMIADAPSDQLTRFLMDVAFIRFVPADGAASIDMPLTAGVFDLLQFQEGRKKLLFEGYVPPGDYEAVALGLFGLPQAFVAGASQSFDVTLSGAAEPLLITAASDLSIGDDLREYVWHIPLWKSLQKIAGEWVLDAAYNLLESGVVGALRLTNLSTLLFKSVCVSQATGGLADLPLIAGILKPGHYDCPSAAGRVTPGASERIVPFLLAGQYVVDLYVTETLYLRVPSLVTIQPLVTTLLSLDL